ncbi:hypothetical protein GCM10027053_27040 [Intrasporangium mesophilum]
MTCQRRAGLTGGMLRRRPDIRVSPACLPFRGSDRGSDRGSSSLLVVGLIGAVLVFTVGAVAMASAVVASHHARTAADLGALAGATALRDGASRDQACAAAASVAVANGAVLQECAIRDGRSLVVVTERRSALWPAPATARSRAGPMSKAPPEWRLLAS